MDTEARRCPEKLAKVTPAQRAMEADGRWEEQISTLPPELRIAAQVRQVRIDMGLPTGRDLYEEDPEPDDRIAQFDNQGRFIGYEQPPSSGRSVGWPRGEGVR